MKETVSPPPSGLSSSAFKAGAPARNYALLMFTRGTVRRFPLVGGRAHTIGRSDKSDIVIPLDTASRDHAVIHDGVPPEIEDVGSLGGTIVAGKKLAPGERVRLQEGMAIQIGTVTLVVHSTADELTLEDREVGPLASGFVLKDEKMLALYRLVEDVAPSDLSVLILGETGTGKELFAQLTHESSPRRKNTFVRLNCAALTEALAESELFGHERGAFTGADRSKLGLFEVANEGTLFLDEVGELSLAMQAKLLRVLDKGEIMPVGAVKPKKIDLRVVAATNRDLRALVSTGRFRADLFYRLTGVVANVPPLRDRPADIPALVEFFAAPCANRAGKPLPHFSPEAMTALCAYRWPGNVRELKNFVERAVLLARDSIITLADLQIPRDAHPAPPTLGLQSTSVEEDATFEDAPTRTDLSNVGPAPARTDDVQAERARIVDALARAHGNQARAARLLGISRRTLINRLDAYALPRPRKNYPG
jgi:two-component system response regulator AtoC